MQRDLLDPVGRLPVAGVVRRLCGVQAQVASSAELAVRVRREESRPGEVSRALSEGRLIKTWAMRGALHMLTPEEGGAFLSLMAAGRPWERPSWKHYFQLGERPKPGGASSGDHQQLLSQVIAYTPVRADIAQR
jgi:hypothetical protein